jgi:cysteinyl-tRNA synthetase
VREVRIRDSLSGELRALEPREPGRAGIYACGPTTYSRIHIGNARPYVVFILLGRFLEHEGYDVDLVVNVTDINDKIYAAARDAGVPSTELAAEMTGAYVEDTDRLGLGRPDHEPLASETIPEIVALIEALIESGHAYESGGDVYFRVRSFDGYGKLSNRDPEEMDQGEEAGTEGLKEDGLDFALWKARKPDEDSSWDSPWGPGRPGWHIECSAMAQKYLGDYFDIHCGGEDHIPVHHTNEIAQTEARVGTRLANFWLHGYFLLSNDAKMAKSAGEFLRVQYLVDRGYDPLAFRYLCLTGHYRGQLNFTWDALDAAAVALERMRNGVFALRDAGGATPDAALTERFGNEINDDLNLPRALAVAWETLRGDLAPDAQRATLLGFDAVLGLRLAEWTPKREAVPDAVTALAEARLAARRTKNWVDADRLRTELHAAGWEMEDRPDGYALKRK